MKRLNFFGRERRQSATRRTRPTLKEDTIQTSRFLRLPPEIILLIVDHLSRRSKVSLSETCLYMNALLNKELLFKYIHIKSLKMLISFTKMVKKSERKMGNYVENLSLYRPLPDTRPFATDRKLSYSYVGNDKEHDASYADILLELVKFLPNLRHLVLEEVPPRFNFPASTALCKRLDPASTLPKISKSEDSKTSFKQLVEQNSLRELTIISELGWAIALRSSLLWTFGAIKSLCLQSLVIDSASLSNVKYLYDSKTHSFMKQETSNNYHSSVTYLILDSCSIDAGAYDYLEKYFSRVEHLSLFNLRHIKNLELIDYFPRLKVIEIDLASKAFSAATPTQTKQLDIFLQGLYDNPRVREIKLFPASLDKWHFEKKEDE